jgi:hypothetical protein
MTTEKFRHERRASQRFDLHLPVRVPEDGRFAGAFTQNLSIRGALLCTDFHLDEGSEIELMMVMPSELTLSESMCVRCRARVLRVHTNSQKSTIAVQFEKYEFLAQAEEALSQFRRISSLRDHGHVERA